MIFNEGIRVQEAPSCFLCTREGIFLYRDLRDRLFGAGGIWSLRHCAKCGLIWIDPCPVPTEVGKLYERYLTHDFNKCAHRFGGLRKMVRDAVLVARLGYNCVASNRLQRGLGHILSWVGPIREDVELTVMGLRGPKEGKFLDVGCGDGRRLAKMRELGWTVVGVEPDEKAVKIARGSFGLSVHKGTLEEVGFPPDYFDGISMNHVFEHLLDPIGTMRECRRVLKPAGRLVIVTPNIESLGHRVFGQSWRGLEVPRHIHLFSPCSLRTCAGRAGLQVVKLWTAARMSREIWQASRVTKRNGLLPDGSLRNQGLWLQLEGLAFQAVEHTLCRVRDAGEELVMVMSR